MFRQEYFNLLEKYQDIVRNKEDAEQNNAYEVLKVANDLTKVWAEGLIKEFFPQGYLGHFTNRPTNQANKFKAYTWAKIYPNKNAPKELAYTVGIEAHCGCVVKIDTVGNIGSKRSQYLALRGDFNGQSPIVSMLPVEKGITQSLDQLVAWSIQEIQKFKLTYEDLCTKLQLKNEQDSDFENRQKVRPTKASVEQDMSNKKHSLNRILFGAAGTGKTYNAINHALSIVENKPLDILENEDRTKLKTRFDQYKDQGRIKFVTFHQSFSYEDFVEGIRAETDVSGQLTYTIKPGVFKEICDFAKATVKSNIDNQIDLANKKVWKMSLGRAGVEDDLYRSCLDNNVILLGWGDAVDFTQCEDIGSIKNKLNEINYFKESEDTAAGYVNTFKNKIKVGDIVVITDGNLKFRAVAEVVSNYEYDENQEYGYHQVRKVKWLKTFSPSLKNEDYFNKIFSQSTVYNLENALDKDKLALLLQPEEKLSSNLENKYVLIIDEINRGNISRIFGELITLIEDSKRKGEAEELSVTLPYSKQEFFVPQNLYIIGTMNSSDRSLTGLDIALRRRFTFIEMPPKPELLNHITIEGVNVGKLLKVMNQRIEVLLDRDHCIGHANFMSLTSDSKLDELAQIYKQKIIPQLQEYFFDDWFKINMVLNNNDMFKVKPVEKSVLFPNINIDEVGYFEEQKIWELNEDAFKNVSNFKQILGPQEKVNTSA